MNVTIAALAVRSPGTALAAPQLRKHSLSRPTIGRRLLHIASGHFGQEGREIAD